MSGSTTTYIALTQAELDAAIKTIDGLTSAEAGNYVINVVGEITEGGTAGQPAGIYAIQAAAGVDVTIDGGYGSGATLSGAGTDGGLEGGGIVVMRHRKGSPAGAQPVARAGMHELVDDHQVLALRKRREDCKIGQIAAAEKQRALGVEKPGGCRLERLVLRGVSAQQPRAAGPDRGASGDRRRQRVGQARGGRKPEIIVGGEVEAGARREPANEALIAEPIEIGLIAIEPGSGWHLRCGVNEGR